MLPVNVRTWVAIIADIMESPMVESEFKRLLQECFHHREFTHLSIDATLRCAMRIRGQAPYRASKAERAAAAIDDENALRRVLTIRGRTGAPLCMETIKGESADDVAGWLCGHVEGNILTQVVSAASDAPSGHMFTRLKADPDDQRSIAIGRRLSDNARKQKIDVTDCMTSDGVCGLIAIGSLMQLDFKGSVPQLDCAGIRPCSPCYCL